MNDLHTMAKELDKVLPCECNCFDASELKNINNVSWVIYDPSEESKSVLKLLREFCSFYSNEEIPVDLRKNNIESGDLHKLERLIHKMSKETPGGRGVVIATPEIFSQLQDTSSAYCVSPFYNRDFLSGMVKHLGVWSETEINALKALSSEKNVFNHWQLAEVQKIAIFEDCIYSAVYAAYVFYLTQYWYGTSPEIMVFRENEIVSLVEKKADKVLDGLGCGKHVSFRWYSINELNNIHNPKILFITPQHRLPYVQDSLILKNILLYTIKEHVFCYFYSAHTDMGILTWYLSRVMEVFEQCGEHPELVAMWKNAQKSSPLTEEKKSKIICRICRKLDETIERQKLKIQDFFL